MFRMEACIDRSRQSGGKALIGPISLDGVNLLAGNRHILAEGD